MSVTDATYQDFQTGSGVIRVVYEMTLGEMAIGIMVALLLLVTVLRWFAAVIWRDRD